MNRKREAIKEILFYMLIFGVLYLFYRALWVIAVLPPCIVICRRKNKDRIRDKYVKTIGVQFRDALESLAAALKTGYSVENAVLESSREMMAMYGEDSPICREERMVLNQMKVGISAEQAFRDMAMRTGAPDVETFASVFAIAKRTGGDMVEIIRKTAEDISEKVDTENEIDVLISAKRFEMKIMTAAPLMIILYVELTSGGLLDPLYHNLAGILIMTVCLAVYGAAILIGMKIMKIEV